MFQSKQLTSERSWTKVRNKTATSSILFITALSDPSHQEEVSFSDVTDVF